MHLTEAVWKEDLDGLLSSLRMLHPAKNRPREKNLLRAQPWDTIGFEENLGNLRASGRDSSVRTAYNFRYDGIELSRKRISIA